jgi:hypothetical protein
MGLVDQIPPQLRHLAEQAALEVGHGPWGRSCDFDVTLQRPRNGQD